MENKWKVIFYETEDGKCPVESFINSRSINNQAKIERFLEHLEVKGPSLPRPYADLLEDGIHELRIKLSGNQVRFLYFFVFEDFIIVTHVFIKKTKMVPKTEIKKAKQYREDFFNRYSRKKLNRIYDENI